MDTPWGTAQHQTALADGIMLIETASHGGIWISAERRAAMPSLYRGIKTFAGGNWYEEDGDWCLVALSFSRYFSDEQLAAARATLKWLANNSERFSPQTVLPAGR